MTIYNRDGYNYHVYHDPGNPPLHDMLNTEGEHDEYQWGFSLLSIWASHLDPSDSILWDISPSSIGNIKDFPETLNDYHDFYDRLNGGDSGNGHDINPHTGNPYEDQYIPRGDYTRVLAEFWADGPDSETPPGHWFTILNYVNDHRDVVLTIYDVSDPDVKRDANTKKKKKAFAEMTKRLSVPLVTVHP